MQGCLRIYRVAIMPEDIQGCHDASGFKGLQGCLMIYSVEGMLGNLQC